MLMDGIDTQSLEELRANFNVLDLVHNFQSGELSKWLLALGYTEMSSKVDSLSQNESMLLTKLCKVLGIDPNLTEEEVQYL